MSDDLTPRDLSGLVLDRITALGDKAAEAYFGVSHGTIVAWRNRKTPPSLAAAQRCWDDSPICQAPAIWGEAGTKPEIQTLMPVYNELEPLTFFTLYRSMKLYGVDKINLVPRFRTLIVEARNDLAQKLLMSKSEWGVFPDSDSVLPCGSGPMLAKEGFSIPEPKASRNAFDRLMSHPKEMAIVGGLYRDRKQGKKVQCETAFRSDAENTRLMKLFDGTNKDDGLEETGWIGFGLVRIHRSVFEKIAAEAKPGGLFEDIAPLPGRETEPIGFFRTTTQQRGEDVSLCRRAQKVGFKVFMDKGLLLGHIGKKIY